MRTEQNNTCQLCRTNIPKYKCPTCYILYCSSACFKLHKTTLCHSPRLSQKLTNKIQEEQQAENELIKTDYIEDQSLRLSTNSLEKLRSNPIIKQLLKKQGLREELIKIDNSRQRIGQLQFAMKNNNNQFMKFVEEVLTTLNVKDDNGQLK